MIGFVFLALTEVPSSPRDPHGSTIKTTTRRVSRYKNKGNNVCIDRQSIHTGGPGIGVNCIDEGWWNREIGIHTVVVEFNGALVSV